jgi:hypothetical protein
VNVQRSRSAAPGTNLGRNHQTARNARC